MAGEGLNGVRAELLHPFAQHVLMDAQVSRSLCRRHPALPNQPDRLDLELSTKLSSPHDYLRLHETPKLGVHQTGSSSRAPPLSRSNSRTGRTPHHRRLSSPSANHSPTMRCIQDRTDRY